ETIARGLAKRVTSDVIESVWLGSKKEPLKSPPSEIVAALEGKRIENVRRVGKHIVIDLESVARAPSPAQSRKSSRTRASKSGPKARTRRPTNHQLLTDAQWIVHLGMTGRMLVCRPEDEIEKHTHAIAHLASGRELRFVDPRRFGRLSVTTGFQAAG